MDGFRKKKILLAGVLMIFSYGLVNNTIGFFVTPVSESLGCSRAAFNLYYSVSCIVSLLAAPVCGRFLQQQNARKVIAAGWAVGTVTFAAFSLCTRIELFYAAALFLGLVQQGTTSVAAMVLIQRACADNSGSATGLVMSGTGICSVSMSLVLPVLIERRGWQPAYFLEAVLWFLAMGAAFFLVKGTVEQPDFRGKQTGGAEKGAEIQGISLKDALCRSGFYVLFLCFAVQGMCTIVIQHIPSFLTELGKSAAEAGTVMALFSVILIVGKIVLGILFDHFGAVKSLILNFLSLALGMWLLIGGHNGFLYSGVVLMGFGMASITVLFPLVTEYVFGKREYPSLWGMMSMAISCGTACGSPLLGMVYDLSGSYRPAFLFMPVVIVANAAVIAGIMSHRGTYKRPVVS
ncbi:MFS transporter [Enterocloster lavalensis]|uniref:MFS transporter n=1 Tax=Enterocloster lavalensis TaxID=460384 RepID=UPI0023F1F70D|nr:MFS transporter [Enterocloster lavalensis]